MYPLNRNRRLRSKESLRNLVRESSIHPHDFIAPVFVIEGSNLKEEISSMPGYFRYSLDNLKKEIKELWSIGVQAILLFVTVPLPVFLFVFQESYLAIKKLLAWLHPQDFYLVLVF